MWVLVVIQTVVVVLLAILVVGLLRSHAEILRALHDLGVNLEEGTGPTSGPRTFSARTEPTDVVPTAAPGLAQPTAAPLGVSYDLRGTTPIGDAAQVGVTAATEPTLLAFLSSGCGSCLGFWEAFRSGVSISPGFDVRVVAVTKGPDNESPNKVAELAGSRLVAIMSSEAYEDYQVPIAPYFVLIRDGVIIGEGASASFEQLSGLLERAIADGVAADVRTPSRRELLSGRARGRKVDDELSSAGIGPGHASLYEDPNPSGGDG